MPRGRPKKTDSPTVTPEGLREQNPPTEHDARLSEPTSLESTESPAPKVQVESAPAADESRQEEAPGSLLGYMAEIFRADIRTFMQNFGINGHQPESVISSIMGIAEQIRGVQSAAGAHAGQQEQVPAPDELQSPIPLNVRIASLEMDGDTRALATAEYGDLTIRRIRVKEDEYGTLSVAMPKYRDAGGWKETCRFHSVESRNRLTGAVLDAYGQKLAQIQAQSQAGTVVPEQAQDSGEVPTTEAMEQREHQGAEEPEQGGPVMGGMTL